MNFKELVREVSQRTNYTQKDIAVVVDNIIDIIENTVASGEEVNLQGFGKFERIKRAPRDIKNPRTGEAMSIGEMFSVSFHTGINFKRKVRNIND